MMLDVASIAEEMSDPDAAAPTGTSGVYTSYIGNYYTVYWKTLPCRTVGKLYFTPWDGGSAYRTASVISPNNIIVTAGHCLYDTDAEKWHDNWFSAPAERKGTAIYGLFPWTVCTCL
jgi:hypothetical protein